MGDINGVSGLAVEAKMALQAYVNFMRASLDMKCYGMLFDIRRHLTQKQWTQAVRAVTTDPSTELSLAARNLYTYHTTESQQRTDLAHRNRPPRLPTTAANVELGQSGAPLKFGAPTVADRREQP
jgi:hypothetical protein